jgi:hypothetical protein
VPVAEIAQMLTDSNLDRHLHDYDQYEAESPFISLAVGAVERDRVLNTNSVYSAIDTALAFATDDGAHAGALFFGWTIVALNPAVALSAVAEPVGELNVYRRWSRFQLEGEVTAKVFLPANQIQEVQWWDQDPASGTSQLVDTYINPAFVSPDPIMNVRQLF